MIVSGLRVAHLFAGAGGGGSFHQKYSGIRLFSL